MCSWLLFTMRERESREYLLLKIVWVRGTDFFFLSVTGGRRILLSWKKKSSLHCCCTKLCFCCFNMPFLHKHTGSAHICEQINKQRSVCSSLWSLLRLRNGFIVGRLVSRVSFTLLHSSRSLIWSHGFVLPTQFSHFSQQFVLMIFMSHVLFLLLISERAFEQWELTVLAVSGLTLCCGSRVRGQRGSGPGFKPYLHVCGFYMGTFCPCGGQLVGSLCCGTNKPDPAFISTHFVVFTVTSVLLLFIPPCFPACRRCCCQGRPASSGGQSVEAPPREFKTIWNLRM